MKAEFFQYQVWEDSSRGLLARFILPNGVTALRTHIQSIGYEIYDMSDTSAPVDQGSIDPAVAMFTALQPWKYDKLGYGFRWPHPGIENAGIYRVLVTFTCSDTIPELLGKKFTLVWEAEVKDPLVV